MRGAADGAAVRARACAFALALFAFAWCWITGARGFFGLDQSIAMDGAWRLLQGQVPFRDFWTPHGLPLMAALAWVFEGFGASHTTYLGFAAAQAAAGAWLSFRIARHWTGSLGLACVAGLGSAIWLQAPHGTPFSEQTAFLLTLCVWSLLLPRGALPSEPQPRRSAHLRILVAGGVAMLAILTKQNAGALSLLLDAGLLVMGARLRGARVGADSVRFAIGFLGVGLGFALWLKAASDPAAFWRSYVTIPAGLLGERVGQPDAPLKLLFGHGHFAVRFVTLLVCVPLWMAWRRSLAAGYPARAEHPTAGWALLFCLGIHLHHTVFTLLTHNHPENGYPFVGLSLAIGAAWIPRVWSAPVLVRSARITCGLTILWVLLRGLDVGWSRSVHTPVLRDATYETALPFDGWRRLQWASPTRYGEASLEAEHLVELAEYLERRPGGLFVFPEQTFLYTLLRRTPPQPLLWFHAGVTYPADSMDPEDPESSRASAGGASRRESIRQDIDDAIVRALEDNGVDTVVLELEAFLSSDAHLERLPALRRLLNERFHPTVRIGPLQILER